MISTWNWYYATLREYLDLYLFIVISNVHENVRKMGTTPNVSLLNWANKWG